MKNQFCPGFLATGICAGLKEDGEKDLGLIYSTTPASAAGVFTKNIVKAAPVLLDMERIKSGVCQAIIVNSKNANCCTQDSMAHALTMAKCLCDELNVKEKLVLVSSTGVIGEPLPIEKIKDAIPELVKRLSESGGKDFAKAIMTTDTVPKIVSLRKKVRGSTFTVTGVAKGSGMIRPDMATMLCFVCTDVKAESGQLQAALSPAVDKSFNRISIDGDTSTNDTVIILANGASKLSIQDSLVRQAFEKSIHEILLNLAKMIVKDGEGATKLVEIKVTDAVCYEDARKVADTVAHSNLVKTALFGEDANWGRIIGAAGRAGVNFDPERIDIFFDDVLLVKNSIACGKSAEDNATKVLKKDEFVISIDLNTGENCSASVYSCDFSVDYVKINADYRT